MIFDLFREINTVVPLVAFGFLMFRVTQSWPADWAKPNHVGHYRAILGLISTYLLLSSTGAIVHEALATQATFVSPLYTLQSIAVLALCYWWPKPKGMRQ